MIHWGLVAGLSYTEMSEMTPGMIVDLYVWRKSYDEEMRKQKWQQT